jgi:hypothetical protein
MSAVPGLRKDHGAEEHMLMQKTSLVVAVGIAGMLGFATVLVFSELSPGQPSASPPLASEEDRINPMVPDCKEIRDVDVQATPRKATPITSSLTTAVQPCAETVSTNGLTDNALINLQRGFDFYSWLTFMALNSPADGPLIGQSAKGLDPTTKWESPQNYRQLADVMLPDGRRPVWGAAVIPPECRSEYRGGMMTIKVIEESFNQPFKSGPLIDQNGNYALFDILINKPMFEYVIEHGLYSKAGQQVFGDRVEFPFGSNPKDQGGQAILGRMGAVMLKVSWKILESNDDAHKFHTVQALVDVPNFKDPYNKPTCVRKTLGLVGFHVGHKTKDRPQWIWTTFEHVDNAPEQKDIDSQNNLRAQYNFYNPACDPMECPTNRTPPHPWGLDRSLKFHSAFRSQVSRTTPLFAGARELNRAFQSILGGTVWENYMLVGTQWPSDFGCATSTRPTQEVDLTCAPAPTFMANTTLETYSQAGAEGQIPVATSSCMACHGNATTQHHGGGPSDFTFILEKAH